MVALRDQKCFLEGAARAALQIQFESRSALSITEGNRIFDPPRSELGRMSHATGVMFRESRGQAFGETNIIVARLFHGLEDVDVTETFHGAGS